MIRNKGGHVWELNDDGSLRLSLGVCKGSEDIPVARCFVCGYTICDGCIDSGDASCVQCDDIVRNNKES
jgi:hypothetical protein